MQIKKKVFIFGTKKVSLVICMNLQRDSGRIYNDPSAVRRQIRALNKRLNKVPERSALETAEVKWTRCKT